ncbi:glyoxalase [Gordonia liuliyuniae]|uniref:Glyoxalase n=1 Tax=Gordonia liuliyuniae TaxID=2911517 RepID=A0ABS9IU98_9ACTN|nr:glyoxalase [Gordonia liuliyuniae]MCF8589062.1 glyoxalase [Gordonia liuliyuniae]
MPTITSLTIEADDPAAAEKFYTDAAFGVALPIRVEQSSAPTTGFRGFTLSIVTPQPSAVDALMGRALAAGAVALKPAKKSLWGYGGSIQAPDGTVWTFASSKKKDSGPLDHEVEQFVVQLGPADVGASKKFYVENGFAVARSYGSRYAEFDTGTATLALTRQANLAKVTGLSVGTGSHRVRIGFDADSLTDPDGFVWTTGAG